MLKKCLKTVLYICILLSFCVFAVNAAACCDEQNLPVVLNGLSEQNDESARNIFEHDDLTASIPCFHEAPKISPEHSSLSRKITIRNLYSVELLPEFRCELIFNRLCAKLNDIGFQRILKQNE